MGFNGTYYNVDGERYPRVTSILGVLDKPFLSRWQLNKMGECIKEDYLTLIENGRHIDIDLLIDKGKKHPNVMRDMAGARGTYLHSIFEKRFKCEALDDVMINDEKVQPFIYAVNNWIEEHKIEALDVEMQLVSKKHKFAGTCDLVCWHEQEGKPRALAIIDLKSGKGTYDTHRLQLAAYSMAYEEMTGTRPDISFILHAKNDTLKEQTHIHYHEIPKEFDTFLKVYDLWKWRGGKA